MRTCTNCYQSMAEGYLLEELGFTFCSDFCLDIAYPGSSKELANMTDEQLEDSTWYWTSWEEDEDEDESSSMDEDEEAATNQMFDSIREVVTSLYGRPDVNKYHYEDYEDGTYFEDGE